MQVPDNRAKRGRVTCRTGIGHRRCHSRQRKPGLRAPASALQWCSLWPGRRPSNLYMPTYECLVSKAGRVRLYSIEFWGPRRVKGRATRAGGRAGRDAGPCRPPAERGIRPSKRSRSAPAQQGRPTEQESDCQEAPPCLVSCLLSRCCQLSSTAQQHNSAGCQVSSWMLPAQQLVTLSLMASARYLHLAPARQGDVMM